MKNILTGKKILITAGPVWAKVDEVRVITNIFGGRLGTMIALLAYKLGAEVTLILGPSRGELPKIKSSRFRLMRFRYYEEILYMVKKEVATRKYDILIHSAAVSDYLPEPAKGKIKSGKNQLIIKLRPTVKIVDLVKKLDPKICLVKFKLEVGLPEKELIKIAGQSMKQSDADYIVANDFSTVTQSEKKHVGFIISQSGKIIRVVGKEKIATKLLGLLAKQ